MGPEEFGAYVLRALVAEETNKFNRGNEFGSPAFLTWAGDNRDEAGRLLNESWSWLEYQIFLAPTVGHGPDNGWRYVTKRGVQVAADENAGEAFRSAIHLPRNSLHAKLEAKTRPPFLRGEYDTAVIQAMRTVELEVRRLTKEVGLGSYGVALMRAAFHSETGPLRDPDLESGERQAMSDLFAGTTGFLRNSVTHREVDLSDPMEVVDLIRLADLLMKILERAEKRGITPPESN